MPAVEQIIVPVQDCNGTVIATVPTVDRWALQRIVDDMDGAINRVNQNVYDFYNSEIQSLRGEIEDLRQAIIDLGLEKVLNS